PREPHRRRARHRPPAPRRRRPPAGRRAGVGLMGLVEMGAAVGETARRAGELAASVARTRLGRADRPRLLTYIVTFRCNARCVMCDSWRKDGEGELTLEQIERIYRQLPPLHAVRLTGGEPFVRKD